MKTIAEQWLEASEWDEKQLNVPTIITRTIVKELRKILSKAKPFKQGIKFPKGEKPMSMKVLKKKAWDAFSKFIRQRDADENGNCKCCTCEKVQHWKLMQAGHFKSRIYENTLFDETNNHAQCAGCNMPPNNGKPLEYVQFLNKKYGYEMPFIIIKNAYRRTMKRDELENILKKYIA